MSEEETAPSWMSRDNDDKHRKETAPLLGSGPVDFEEKPRPDDEEAKDEEKGDPKKYGAVTTTSAAAALKVPEEDPFTSDKEKAADLILKDPSILMPHAPRVNPCLWLFHLLQGVAVLTAFCLLATQLIPIVIVLISNYHDPLGFLNLALKAYISLFCIVFIFVETGVPVPLVRDSPLLQSYISRGFIYSFLGLICVEESYSERVKDLVQHGKDEFHVGWVSIFMQISSWFMLGVGSLYMLMGIFCLKGMRDRMHEKEREDWKIYRQELKLWKETNGSHKK